MKQTEEAPRRKVRVAVVGAGMVGSTFAYTLLLSGLASEIVLMDINRDRAEGEVMDLNHSVPFSHPTRIWAGDYDDCAEADVTVIAAGAAQKPGETRLDLAKKNVAIFREIIPAVTRRNKEGLLLVATNPVDVLTHASLKLSGMPAHRVMGSGTVLDTARFRYELGRYFDVDSHSVHAYIIGEHGDSEVPVWSLANVAGMRLSDFCKEQGVDLGRGEMEEIFRLTREAAYRIIKLKGATYYAVAAGILQIIESVLRDQNTVLSVSSLIDDYHGVDGLCLSLPSVIGHGGIERVLRLKLNANEAAGLKRSANVLKQTIESLALDEPRKPFDDTHERYVNHEQERL